jgi:menaquinone-dependent protoporphyrinogen oxidase
MAESTGAREHRVFPGRLDRHELGLMERAVVGLVRAHDGDYRPWPEIVAWADAIADGLTGAAPR